MVLTIVTELERIHRIDGSMQSRRSQRLGLRAGLGSDLAPFSTNWYDK